MDMTWPRHTSASGQTFLLFILQGACVCVCVWSKQHRRPDIYFREKTWEVNSLHLIGAEFEEMSYCGVCQLWSDKKGEASCNPLFCLLACHPLVPKWYLKCFKSDGWRERKICGAFTGLSSVFYFFITLYYVYYFYQRSIELYIFSKWYVSFEMWQQKNDLFSVHYTAEVHIIWINKVELNKCSFSVLRRSKRSLY